MNYAYLAALGNARTDGDAAADAADGLTTLSLFVPLWGADLTVSKPVAMELTLYELDSSTEREAIAKFSFKLLPPKKGGINRISKANWSKKGDGGDLKWWFEASPTKKAVGEKRSVADFVLYLGGRIFYLKVPNPHDEKETYEIGFTLTGGGESLDVLLPVFSAKVPARNWVKRMRAIPGRFDDPERKPPVTDLARIDEILLDRLGEVNAKTNRGDDDVVDLDGLSFDALLAPGKTRRGWIDSALATNQTYIDAGTHHRSGDRHDKPSWQGHDITKAFYIVHDVGRAVSGGIRYATPKVPRRGTVHGYINWGGYYAAGRDFRRRANGVVWAGHCKLGRASANYLIGVEHVPVVAWVKKKNADGVTFLDYIEENGFVDADLSGAGFPYASGRSLGTRAIACVGYKPPLKGEFRDAGIRGKRTDYWLLSRWTQDLVDTLAELYVLASARAGHLLTITCHIETDRNLAYGRTFPEARAATRGEYTRAKYLSAGAGTLKKKLATSPRNLHGDPYGMDMQVVYDAISARLESMPGLGKLTLPAGHVRYGIHPRRVTQTPIHTSPPVAKHGGTSPTHKHTFPRQSNPTVETDSSLQRPL
jgi:hypothetical protein